MLPERFIDEVERAEKVSRFWRGLTVAAIFFTSFLLVAPLLHEYSHILSLNAFNCGYAVDWGFSVTGLSASVQPLCTLEGFRQIFFYSSGYLTMILAAGISSAVSIERNNSFLVNEFLSAMASGLLVSLIFTLELRGDVTNALNVLGVRPVYGQLFYMLVVLGSSSMIYLVVRNFLDQNGSAVARGRL